MKYRPLDPKTDWEFFMPDCPIAVDCLSDLFPLTEESARDLWAEFICSTAGHPMKLPDEDWPAQLYFSEVKANWPDDWNDDSAAEFQAWLGSALPWSPETWMFFTWSASQTMATSWKTFLRCWRHFLFHDECPFLWSLEQAEAIGFTPRGFAHVGLRFSPKAEE